MTAMTFDLGAATPVAAGGTWGPDFFGYLYTAFRGFGRFEAQLADQQVGMMVWPGGFIAETFPDRYGMEYPGLFNPAFPRPDLAEMMAEAVARGAGLAVVLPSLRYLGNEAALRGDLQGFLGDLLGGAYGPAPERLVLQVGSEFYGTLPDPAVAATQYGALAEVFVQEISAALADPGVNTAGMSVEIAVQGGRDLAEDAAIRAELSDASLRAVDQVIHYRFALTAEGIDGRAEDVGAVMEAWRADLAALGQAGPGLFLGSWGVASYTRDEALRDFLAADAAAGGSLGPGDVDLAGRSTTAFEQFWQDAMAARDYGADHPRLILEMLTEYGAEGMTAAAVYGTDVMHPGRTSFSDVNGVPQDFVGQQMLDMMAESVGGTRALDIGLQNAPGEAVWAYGFENDDKLVVFLAADGAVPGAVTLELPGMGSVYRQAAADSLRAAVPSDWMARFGIPDNPAVDESAEGESYALGARQGAVVQPVAGGVQVGFSAPGEVVRVAFAKTDAGLAEIAGFSDGDIVALDPAPPGGVDGTDADLPMVPMPEDIVAEDDDDMDFGGAGDALGILLGMMPLLFLVGMA